MTAEIHKLKEIITEDYVSFEIAKLLKEKGFNECCRAFRSPSGHLFYSSHDIKNFEDGKTIGGAVVAPTLQMAMKWLREVHKIYIDISPTYSEVEKTIHFIWQIFDSNYDNIGDCDIFYPSYEEAVKAALKYCLENLI